MIPEYFRMASGNGCDHRVEQRDIAVLKELFLDTSGTR